MPRAFPFRTVNRQRSEQPTTSVDRPVVMRMRCIAVVLPGLLAACHRPVLWPEPVTPVILGTLAWENGLPVQGEEIRISAGRRDSTCKRATRRTMTGPQGYFQLPPASLDVPIPTFYACAFIATETLFIDAGVWYAPARVDSVNCIAWHWEVHIRLTCEHAGEHRIFEGGRWRRRPTDPYDGFFRALFVSEQVITPGSSKAVERPVLYLHWLRPVNPANGHEPPYVPAGMTRIPIEPAVFKLAGASFHERNDTTFLTIGAFKHVAGNDTVFTQLTYAFSEFMDGVVK